MKLETVSVLVAVAVFAVLPIASSAATWEIGFPYQFSRATDVISGWASGLGVSVAAVERPSDRFELGVRMTYRQASYGDVKPNIGMVSEEVMRDFWGDETRVFTGALFVRVPSPDTDVVYMTFTAGLLYLDIGTEYWTTEDVLNAPGQLHTSTRDRDSETLGFAAAGVGVVLPEIYGARVLLELNGGFISNDSGYWVTVGPYIRFGG